MWRMPERNFVTLLNKDKKTILLVLVTPALHTKIYSVKMPGWANSRSGYYEKYGLTHIYFFVVLRIVFGKQQTTKKKDRDVELNYVVILLSLLCCRTQQVN